MMSWNHDTKLLNAQSLECLRLLQTRHVLTRVYDPVETYISFIFPYKVFGQMINRPFSLINSFSVLCTTVKRLD